MKNRAVSVLSEEFTMWYEDYLIKRACTEKRAFSPGLLNARIITAEPGTMSLAVPGAVGALSTYYAGKPDDPKAIDESGNMRALLGIPVGVASGAAGAFLGELGGSAGDVLLRLLSKGYSGRTLANIGILLGTIGGSRIGGEVAGKYWKSQTRKADEERK